ncbi:MAG TPA: dihydroorotase [Armatimonadota bacterium]|nr:dihydroorotase [Armatimonadota bacterium]
MRWLLKGGRLIVPSRGIDEARDLLIEDGVIRSLSFGDDASGASTLDLSGLVVAPGFIDIHTHLREPGFEHKETIATGVQSAAAGGFTTICCMPNTNPAIDNGPLVEFVRRRAEEAGPVRVLPMGSVTRGMGQDEMADLGEMAEAGASAFTDDAFPIQSSRMMRLAMRYATTFDLPVVTHCEDKSLTIGASMNEGYVSAAIGIRAMPRTAEEIHVARNILLAEETGCRLHIAHISTRRSVEMVRRARAHGIRVTAEACPHHFSLTDSAVAGEDAEHPGRAYDTNTKMNPPLRTPDDVAAVVEGLQDGTISCIATDHAPHSIEEKGVEFDLAPFGIIGFETALAVSLTYLVRPGWISLPDLVKLMTSGAAGVLASPNFPMGAGELSEGGRADVTIFDPAAEWIVEPSRLLSKSKNTPYGGHRLFGRVRHVFAGGRLIVRDGHPNGAEARGEKG